MVKIFILMVYAIFGSGLKSSCANNFGQLLREIFLELLKRCTNYQSWRIFPSITWDALTKTSSEFISTPKISKCLVFGHLKSII